MAAVTGPRPLLETDDRAQFDCGRDSLNAWFRRHAWANHADGISRTNVLCEGYSGAIIGYVTLCSAQIQRAFLAKRQQRNRPDPIPVTLLAQLAVHKGHQGQGHSAVLLLFALRAALAASREIGSFGVITHPIDDGVRSFYARWGFDEIPFDPQRAMLVRMVDLEKSLNDP